MFYVHEYTHNQIETYEFYFLCLSLWFQLMSTF
jgi:hypothetical protein